jgi:hypothetical protein
VTWTDIPNFYIRSGWSARKESVWLAKNPDYAHNRMVLSAKAWLRKLSRRLSQPGFPRYGITFCLPVIHSQFVSEHIHNVKSVQCT